MPTLKRITCSVTSGVNHIRAKEYGHRFTDGGVETYIAVPDADRPFSILVESQGYIAPGIAAYVFIDGEYQANRNIIGLQPPESSSVAHKHDVNFIFRQKEEKLADGSFVGRDWSFAKLKKNNESATGSARLGKNVPNPVGTIEIVVLRCTKKQPRQASAKHVTEIAPVAQKQASRKLSSPAPIVETALEPQNELGGLFGLFDGPGDDPRYDEYPPRIRLRLPTRVHSGWPLAPDKHKHEHARCPYSGGMRDPPSGTSSSELIDRDQTYAWDRYRRMPYRDNSHNRKHLELQKQHELPSRRANYCCQPSNDEFDRLIFLHEQLNRNTVKAREVRKSQTLFERTLRSASRQRMQELSGKRLEEIEGELKEVEAKCAADTNFIFECLVDMNRMQLAFATSVLRERNIQLPSFEEIRDWQQQQRDHERNASNAAADNMWQSIGEGVTQKEKHQNSRESGQQRDKIHETSHGGQPYSKWGDDAAENQLEDHQQGNNNDNAWVNWNQDQPTEWNDDSRGKQRDDERTNRKVTRCMTRSETKSTATKSSIRNQHEDSWAAPRAQSKQKSRWDVREKASRATSGASRKYKSDATTLTAATEPKRVIKPYWLGLAEDIGSRANRNVDIKAHARDPYQLPARPAFVEPKDKPKDVSHGVQMGKGAAYTHKTGRPIYLDSMQDPYAVFVFHYRSKHVLEEMLGRKLGDEHEAVEQKLRLERLMQFSKDELAHELLKSRLPHNHIPSQVRPKSDRMDEIKPEDSISQVKTSVRESGLSDRHRPKKQDRGWTEGLANQRTEDKQNTGKRGHNEQRKKKSRWANISANQDHWKKSTSRCSQTNTSRSRTPEHFPGQNLQTSQDNKGVVW